MSASTTLKDPAASKEPVIVVAGDVCIDWLSMTVPPLDLDQEQDDRLNWRLKLSGGRAGV